MSIPTLIPNELLGYRHDPPFDSGFLPVGEIHKLHYEQYGKPDGKPVIFLHGGPGGSTSSKSATFFDPAVYRVVVFDQRGAGRSLPCAELRENTTAHLLSDIEALREHVGVEKWHMVFGGSWGSALSLLYAQYQPHRVGSLVIRGIFFATKEEFDFSRGPDGSARLFPEIYDEWISYLPEADRANPLKGYYKLATSDDPMTRLEACRAYNRWELMIGALKGGPDVFRKLEDEDWVLSHGRLELHYHSNYAFLEDGHIMNNLDKIRHIPCTMVQGRYDLLCTPRAAWQLHKAWPQTELHFIDAAGHSAWVRRHFTAQTVS